MKHALLWLPLVIGMVVAPPGFGQTGTICLFADPQGTQCNITDAAPGLMSVYVIHSPVAGVTAAQFAAPKPDCMVGATWVTDSSPFSMSDGNSQTGATVVYGRCLTEPTHILTVQYMVSGSSGTDCAYPVIPRPGDAEIVVAGCDFWDYDGIGGVSYVNSMLPCQCSLPPDPPSLSVSPTLVEFGNVALDRSFRIRNAGGQVLSWSVSESESWLHGDPLSGLGDRYIYLGVDREGLPVGSYATDVVVASNGGSQVVHVTMEVAPILYVEPASLRFEADQSTLLLKIRNKGTGTMVWSITADQPWLAAYPSEGLDNRDVNVSVNRSGLPDGTYTGSLRVEADPEVKTVPVTMLVVSIPQLSVRPTILSFSAPSTPKSFKIENAGTGTLTWSISKDQPWISVTPLSGTGDRTISVQVTPPGPPGPSDGHITVQSNGGTATVLVRWATGDQIAGAIGIFSDPAALGCNLVDSGPGLMTAYVVHVLTPGATASQFAAPIPACMVGAAHLGETSPFPVVFGNTQQGVSIGYGQCLKGPILLLTVRYFVQGSTQRCCVYPVVPDAAHGQPQIAMVDCDYEQYTALGAFAVVNPEGSCQCGSIKTQEATWGKIKSMYWDE